MEKIMAWHMEFWKNYYTSEKPYCCSTTYKKSSLGNWKATRREG